MREEHGPPLLSGVFSQTQSLNKLIALEAYSNRLEGDVQGHCSTHP
jgi:hypothetical protein